MPTVVDSILTLLHIAVFLFFVVFVGLVNFFFSKHNDIAYITLIPIVVCVGLHIPITLLPVFRPVSPMVWAERVPRLELCLPASHP